MRIHADDLPQTLDDLVDALAREGMKWQIKAAPIGNGEVRASALVWRDEWVDHKYIPHSSGSTPVWALRNAMISAWHWDKKHERRMARRTERDATPT